ncbi:MAG TPA: copper chaperone PCu(A)C [Burkholderiales bacterium]|nr:copper chaperone PCu(A)C [Burkholderiales bacterium]
MRLMVCAAICLFSALAAGEDVVVKEAWARATSPGQKTASVYLEIVSSADAMLIGAKCAVAKSAQMHAMRVEDGVMKMRAVQRIALPARKTVKLAPGGLHIMLAGVARPLVENETIPLELTIETSGGVTSKLGVQVEVRAIAADAHGHAH